MEKDLEINDIKDFIRRRKKHFVISFFIILICGLIYSLALPSIYKSEAIIRLEGQQISEDFVKPTIKEFAVERIQKIGQQVMSRPKLLQIINEFELYEDLKENKSNTELVAKMRNNISLETITAEITSQKGRKTKVTVAFKISFEGKDPETVKTVTERLANLYLEEDIKNREGMASGTTKFLESELSLLSRQIDDQENKISEFKKSHARELPSDQFYNLQAIASLERDLGKTEMRLRVLQEKKLLIESQLVNVEPLAPIVIDGEDLAVNPSERLKRLRLQLASMRSIYSEKHPDIKKLKREIKKLESQIESSDSSVAKIKRLNQLEIELATAKAELGPKHPDVKAINREIQALKNEIEVSDRTKVEISEEKPDNPVYINLKTQNKALTMEIANLEEEKQKLKHEIDDYQKRIKIGPVVEKELNSLNRDYNHLKSMYADLSNRLMNAQVVQEMEGKQKGERFSITSPAFLPEKPSKPKRLAILLISFLVAIGISSALIVVQESIDDTLKTSSQLKELAGVPVLSTVSYIVTDPEKKRMRMKRLGWTLATILLLGGVLYFVDRYLIELDKLWVIIMNRLMMIA
jgi:uncharacterized protein involved in exopolysaccharide biosynthesis